MPKGSGKERLGARDERQIQSGNHVDLLQREGNEEASSKAGVTNNGGVVRGNPIILSHGNMEASVPVYIPLDKVQFPFVDITLFLLPPLQGSLRSFQGHMTFYTSYLF